MLTQAVLTRIQHRPSMCSIKYVSCVSYTGRGGNQAASATGNSNSYTN